MSDLFWLTDEQMERLRPFFPKSHGKPRVAGADHRTACCSVVVSVAAAARAYSTESRYRIAIIQLNTLVVVPEVSVHQPLITE